MRFWLKINSLFPRGIARRLEKKMHFSGEIKDTRKKVGFVLGFPWFFGIAVAINMFVLLKYSLELSLGAGVAGLIGAYVLLLLMMQLGSVGKANRIEKSLPDALELIATNIKSGLTIETALIDSARPEFGELGALLKKAAKEMFSGKPFEKALKSIAQIVDSQILNRTVLLVSEGMRRGGSLGDLLLRIANDLRSERALKDEINANISMYIILIFIASMIGAPLLFGAGTVVANVMTENASSLNIPQEGAQSIPLLRNLFSQTTENPSEITPEMIENFSGLSLLITSFFASLLIGVIKYNKETQGLKYFPVIFIISFLIYIGSIVALGNFTIF